MGTPLRAMLVLARAAGPRHHAAQSSPPGVCGDGTGSPSPIPKDKTPPGHHSSHSVISRGLGEGKEKQVAADSPRHGAPTASQVRRGRKAKAELDQRPGDLTMNLGSSCQAERSWGDPGVLTAVPGGRLLGQ